MRDHNTAVSISGRLNNVPVPRAERPGRSSCKEHAASRRCREVVRHGDAPEARA
jgi:hypothetical protein